ncbi:hypothetical protein [Abditibacterium utsteinense]|uniref:hypothetical protein n=1 Tax=Abditibacterium utsteinense TaxID=1960156 RepID=UPI001475DD60|nr:hypothetical protein [Abditibacterium utsteinense]
MEPIVFHLEEKQSFKASTDFTNASFVFLEIWLGNYRCARQRSIFYLAKIVYAFPEVC